MTAATDPLHEFVRDFVRRLSAAPNPPDTTNPYAGLDASSHIRRRNLTLYLERMTAHRPRLLLVGEAPGYRGCGATGVPFTSAAVLLAEPSPFGLFGATAGFRAPDGPRREATASILWATLIALDALPLLWNALPFHPHRPGRPDSNRLPAVAELAAGRVMVKELIHLFDIARVVAVGRVAAVSLARWDIPATPIRHPSHGGKTAFAQQLAALVRDDLAS
jgi:uracil-DNA glycosylase